MVLIKRVVCVLVYCNTMNIMRLNESDVARAIIACKLYRDQTSSDYLWDEYSHLIEKLEQLCEQGYCNITK